MVSTTFRITQTGTPVLSAKVIEETETAARMVEDFLPGAKPSVIDMDVFLQEYLHMQLEEKCLSHDGHILGMTVFADTDKLPIWIPEKGEADYYSVKAGTVLVDSRLQTEEGLRFTKAHEAGHAYFHNAFFQRNPGVVFCRESAATMEQKQPDKTGLWSEEEWREWQANTFASCLLMPEPMVKELIGKMPPIHTGDPFGDREERICRVSETFRVSRTAAAIRLEGMGLLKEEEKTGYVFLGTGTDTFTGRSSWSPYYDELGNYIPERPVDPPDAAVKKPARRRPGRKKSNPQ